MPDTLTFAADLKTNAPVVEALASLLADTHALALKTQNFHWNVTGPDFFQLHGMFESQYTALNAAVDALAERIRALGYPAPGGYRAFGERTAIAEAQGVPAAAEMVRQLLADNETAAGTARRVIEKAEEAG